MENFQRDFKGIWIPKEVWLDKKLNALDKIILMEIHSLDNGESGCYASNKYLADFCQCTETKVSTTISKLKEFGYIELNNFDGRHRILKIKRLPLNFLKADFKKFKPNNIDSNIGGGGKIKLDKSNLINNVEKEDLTKTVIITKQEKENKILRENIKCIIDYLNESINAKYKYNTKATVKLVNQRFKEGYTLDDFYDVIDKKVKEWINTDMEKYLRPETLFGSKFENYVNQKDTFKGKPKSSYSSKPIFDNTVQHNLSNPKISDAELDEMTFEQKRDYVMDMAYADMTIKQKEFFNKYCLARDKNGNLLEF